jgi:ADP-ribose pyrophosphatase
MNSASDPSPARWERLGADRALAHTRILTLQSRPYRHPRRQTERDFVVIDAPDWVNVVALTPDHRLVMVNQFRHGIDTFSWETPGGVVEAGEDPVTAGVRELCEETGFVGSGARLLGQVHPNPAIQNNTCYFVLVENAVRSGAQAWDPDEEIEVQAVPAEEVLGWAFSGRITHGLVVNALCFFSPRWQEIRGAGV